MSQNKNEERFIENGEGLIFKDEISEDEDRDISDTIRAIAATDSKPEQD